MPSASDRGGGAEPPNGTAAGELDADTTDTAPAAFADWRLRFRVWRGARPFWAGLWTLLAGLELAFIPLSDLGRFVSSGQVAFTAVLPGIVLVIAGAFMWFSPPNRTMAGFLAMVFAVASLVLSNLGGLLIGMLLGIVGGAMAVGWTDAPRTRSSKRFGSKRARSKRSRGGNSVPVVLVLVAALLTMPMVDDADARSRCLLLDPSSPLTSGLQRLGVDLTGDACLVSVDDLGTGVLAGVVPDLEPAAADALLERLSAAEVLADAAGLDPAAVEDILGLIAAETGMTTSAADGPTGADLVTALTAALADGGTPLDLDALLALLTDTLSGSLDADDLLNRLLALLGDTVDRVLETVPALPGDEASAPEPSGDAQTAAVAPAASGGHDEGHTAPAVISDLNLATLDVNALSYVGMVTVPTATGTMDVLRFEIDSIDATGLELILPDGQATDFGIANQQGGSLHGEGVVLDCTRLSLEITGTGGGLSLPAGLQLTFSTSNPPPPLVLSNVPQLSTRNVDIDLVTLSVDVLDLFGAAGGAS